LSEVSHAMLTLTLYRTQ